LVILCSAGPTTSITYI